MDGDQQTSEKRAAAPAAAGHHWPIGVLAALAAVLIFMHLGRDYLWADEGDTAVFAASITKFGVPRAWDGVTFTDSDFGAQLTSGLVMVGHPWAQYYAVAASFLLFGQSAWAARAPFALAGVATVIAVYGLVWMATRRRWTAATASALLISSVQFLVYARQSRHYTLTALLVCLLLVQFFRLRSWPQAILFAALAVLQFHAHPSGLAPLAAMAVLTIASPAFRPYRRWFWRAAAIAAVGIAPWLWWTRAALTANTTRPQSVWAIVDRFAQFAVESASVTTVVGTAILVLVCLLRRWTIPARPLAILCAAALMAYGIVIAATQSREQIWEDGVRQASAVIPIAAMLAALAIGAVARTRRVVWAALAAIFAFTNLPRLTPWTVWAAPAIEWDAGSVVVLHRPLRPIDRWLRMPQLAFVRGLITPNQGTVAAICEFLEGRAKPGDILLTNYAWEPLYFHTGLPQALKVLPSSPIYNAARERHLPDYVFYVDRVRWIVDRRAWGANGGQDLNRVLTELRARGYRVTLAAAFPETVWENRENIHFRRFPNDKYFYPWYGLLPDARIYKVDPPVS